MSRFIPSLAGGLKSLSRREVLIGGIGTTALLATAPALLADTGTLAPLAPAAQLTNRVAQFMAMLDADKRAKASFEFAGSQWRDWTYFGGGGFIKPGLRLEQMTDAEKDATWAILAEVLSADGLAKARNVMLLQDILAAAGNGAGRRSSQRFSVAVFGTPAASGAWGLRLEGHHLSLSFSVARDQIVSVTPAAFAALPNRVLSGRHAGLHTLEDEEKLARRLQLDLSPNLQARAEVSERHLFNIMSSAGRERSNATKTGLAAADMTAGQRDLLRELVETYAVAPYTGPLGSAQKARLDASDMAATHFAWYGPNTEAHSFGYRIIGDRFVIELGCIDRDAQHLHPVYHDLGNTLGVSA